MPLVRWEHSFNLGVEPFDGHHLHLVDLLNSLYQMVMNREPEERLTIIFKELVAYCDYHFLAEETWMTEQEYPHRERHFAAHRKFQQDILDFRKLFHGDQVLISFGLLKYLKEWLLDHILDEDRQMAAHGKPLPAITLGTCGT